MKKGSNNNMKSYSKIQLNQVKRLVCLMLVFTFSTSLYAQKKIIIEKGKINFTSNAPLELIKASSDQMKAVIDPVTNQFALSVSIQSFKGFNGALQAEHFKEKFMESDKYPVATFTGKIIEKVDFFTDGVYDVRVKGDLEMHGQKQQRIIKSKIIVKNGVVSILADFMVPLTDHNITVPHIITEKIATEIEVNVYASVTPQK